MHYRGKIKKRLFHLTIESSHPPKSDIITNPSGDKLGTIIKLIETTAHKYEALAILELKSEFESKQHSLLIKGQDSLVMLHPLIYH